jgi:hypothetical protein
MEHFDIVTGPVAALDRNNVDTDQIIPKQFLKRIERTGFGEFLFFDWAKDPDFELNRPDAQGARILPRGATSAAAARASMRRGRFRSSASRRSWRRASATSS